MVKVAWALACISILWCGTVALNESTAMLRRAESGSGTFTANLGWVDASGLRRRRANARRLVVTGSGMLLILVGWDLGLWGGIGALSTTGLGSLFAGMFVYREGAIWYPRSTLYCVQLFCGVFVIRAVELAVTGEFGSLSAVVATGILLQMYMVAAVQKFRTRAFWSGEVLTDLFRFAYVQRCAGSREFAPVPFQLRLGTDHRLRRLNCALSWLTIVGEASMFVIVLIEAPLWLALGVAVPLHGAFAVLAPKRITPFSLSCIGLLLISRLD